MFSVCSHTEEYLPWLGGGGYLPWLGGGGGTLAEGYLPWQGVPTLAGGVPTLAGGYPIMRYPHLGGRTADGVLDTLWSVCLLHSGRRTFLLKSTFQIL